MFLEKCTAARGKCKATDEPFKKGDVRLAVCSKAHKAYYSMAGMGDAVRPIVEASEGEYTASDITGFLALSKDERAAVCAAVDVKATASAKKRSTAAAGVTIAEVTVAAVKDEKKAAADTPASANRRSGRRSSAVSAPPRRRRPPRTRRARGWRLRRSHRIRAPARGTHRAEQGEDGSSEHWHTRVRSRDRAG